MQESFGLIFRTLRLVLSLFLGSLMSIYKEQSLKGPRHNQDPFPKKMGNPPVWKPPSFPKGPKIEKINLA